MSRVFWTAVHKYHEGQLKSFLPGDELPEEFNNEDSAFYQYTRDANEEQAEAADNTAALQGGNVEDDEVDVVERPKGNATRDEWVKYAESRGVLVDDSAKREDIRDTMEELDAANVEAQQED
jgi:hypothetical protein